MNSIAKRLEEVIAVLTRYRPIIDNHMVTYFTQNLWEKNVPTDLKKEANRFCIEDMLEEFWSSGHPGLSDLGREVKCVEINRFTNHVKSFYLSSFEKCLNFEQFQQLMRSWGCNDRDVILDQSFMSWKKSHEVEVLSSVIASLADAFGCSHVVDIGGGKGYLSSVLCLQHKLKVLGLDCSSSNTHVATKRTQKMQKSWRGIRKRIEMGEAFQKKGKHWRAKTLSTDGVSTPNHNDNNISNGEEESRGTLVVSDVSDIFKQTTHFVSKDTKLLDLVRQNYPDDNDFNLALSGLHTCGNLASSCLKLFTDDGNCADSRVNLLVNVGCCYHLLTEKYPGLPSLKQSKILRCASTPSKQEENDDCGFPVSQYLCSKRFSLSYNSRVLSSQSVERISMENKKPNEALFYRALLEILLERHEKQTGEVSVRCDDTRYNCSRSVGHIKCTSFKEYVDKATKKLNVQFHMDDSEVESIYEEYKKHQKELSVYFMMRVFLAPLVETVILLDRLLYLHENGIDGAYLVQLFDPVVSPRCYGIIASRKHTSLAPTVSSID